MTITKGTASVSNIKENKHILVIALAVIFFVLLLLRDAYSISINKNIFILLTCLCAITMKTTHVVYLFCFLFPLYVGLPGNYLTLILLLRVLVETRKMKSTTLLLSVLVGVFMFIQNLVTDNTGMVQMVFIPSIILVGLLFNIKDKLDPVMLAAMYSAGVAALGFIMLISTLKVYDISDLMSTSFRLGSANVNYVDSGVMNVNVDPNFYGLFSIAAISLTAPMALNKGTKIALRSSLLLFVLVEIAICLIGLSRAFILVFVAWIILYLIAQKSVKGTLIAITSIIVVVILVVTVMPDVLKTVLARFEDSDMATGNGRMRLINEFVDKWGENIFTVLFGVGLFNCNVHCMPLQFLFGGGLVLFVLIIALSLSYRSNKSDKMSFSTLLPVTITFIMMCTVPSAAMLNFMFPLIVVALATRNTSTTL